MTEAGPSTIVSTGIEGLDAILDGLRIGDNVVWRVDDIEDYRRFVEPFVAAASAQGRQIIYLRFGHHDALVPEGPGIRTVRLEAQGGFETFTVQVYQLITDHGRGAFYVCDCLSDLLSAWATDYMVGNFFRVVCPYLFELDTVAYFALQPQSHSHITLSRIRETTQVLIDVHHADNERQIQPVKVWQRQSPTMFLPHRQRGDRFLPVVDSSDATRLQAALQHRREGTSQRQLDCWDRLFLEAAEVAAPGADGSRRSGVLEHLLQVVIGREPRILELARRYLTLEDLLAIRARMIGTGYIGGKAVGMLLARKILLREDPEHWERHLEPHDSFHLGSDVYYSYLVHNGWWPRLMRQRTTEGYFEEARSLHQDMLEGEIPDEVRLELERVLDYFGQYPILVRSSSLLEDGFGNAFAGKYESTFRVNQGSPEDRMEQLEEAIRLVFASSMSEDALVYRQQRGLANQEEPMGLLLQRVNGRYHGPLYLPDAAGVGVSRNVFAWDPGMDPKAGMLRLVLGLGTRAVDRIEGDHACVVALDQPHRRPFRDAGDAYRYSQHAVDLLDIMDNRLRSMPLRQLVQAAPDLPLRWVAELDREATERSRARPEGGPIWRLTFTPLLRETDFVPLMRRLLDELERAYAYPVDIEFTVHLAEDGTPSINLVQCRPLQTLGEAQVVRLPAQVPPDRLLFSTQGRFMGGNIDQPIDRVIHVDGPRYSALSIPQRFAVARLVGRLNRAISERSDCPMLLIGPGRWGTSSPELGIPVRFADISRVAVLVEVAELGAGLIPDLSFGSHFFQDLVESRIAYVALFPQETGTVFHPEWLDALPEGCRLPLGGDEAADPAVADTLRLYDVRGRGLRVSADVVEQRLFCHQPW
jgi:pyruvate, water dikinase